jgi:hypothetical protein
MSISMEIFGWSSINEDAHPVARIAPATFPFRLQCRACGFEPEDQVIAPRICPKCASSSWERFIKPGSLLENSGPADRSEPTPFGEDSMDA